MLLTWQAFVLQDHVKNLPITEQKRQFLAHQLEYDNMMRQKLILENANANSNSNASGAGGGGGGPLVGDLLIMFFLVDSNGDGWQGLTGSTGKCNLIHPTKGIIDIGFDALNTGDIPPWMIMDYFPGAPEKNNTVPPGFEPFGGKTGPGRAWEVIPIAIIERNIPYPTQQYGINVITANSYATETRWTVSAGWSPYPNYQKYPNSTPVTGRGLTVQPSISQGGTVANSTTYNDMFTIPKSNGGSNSTSNYNRNTGTGTNLNAYVQNIVYI